MEDDKREYRKQLIDLTQKVSDSFDKTVLTLSGGAIGVSFAFLKDIIPESNYPKGLGLLYTAWISWTLSITGLLVSLYMATWAYQRALKQFDREIYELNPGGKYSGYIEFFNAAGALLFVIGVASFILFVSKNYGG